ncbi:MAG: DUF1439 domain-containing protein [Haemophilus parahaemolyticus]|uniref:DUF1439 domain-containing protein n=1 Tax=Haemophilus parahaemolyticus TaxID=735 RepID=UPI0026EC6D7E|nr:DUF1439 domain-containing protein [Haemophilus parahaemolyticus]MBS6008553.1 DUF1439 domain-containing protein [Haemophilus parahaemolyticus]
MKFIYRIVAFFVVAIGVVAVASANLLSISEKEINDYLRTQLAAKIPLADSVGIPGLMQLDYQLHDLVTQIGQTSEKKVKIQGVVDGLLIARGKKHEAKIKLNLDTTPYFDSEKGTIYLKDVRLLSWEVSPEKYQETVQFFLPMLFDGLTNLLNRSPVYTLDETKTKEMLVKKFGKAIIVEKGMLRLETSLF